MSRAWPEWQGAVINGLYPLRSILHGADHGAVFRTEATPRASEAAIKIVRSDLVLTNLQLRHWRAAAALSHPHLVRLFDSGQCQVGDQQFLFVVMEYADQTLAQVLPKRVLTPDEVREMLVPALDALSFLHAKNLVHGQLKPANFLVVGDRLKLASDTVRLVGEPRAGVAGASLYDPPETSHGRFTPAADIWGLGVTVVEALTQCLPWPDKHAASAGLPPNLPEPFVDLAQRCLRHDPANRPTAAELRAPQRSSAPAPAPATRTVARESRPATPAREPRKQHAALLPVVAAAALVILLVLTWTGVRALRGHPTPQPTSPAVTAAQPNAAAVDVPRPASAPPAPAKGRALAATGSKASKPARQPAVRTEQPSQPALDASPSVAHAEMPAVPRSALRTVRGRIRVGVLVMVDRTGRVIEALVEDPGPSSYFAHKAREAAREWSFVPADQPESRSWRLDFEFSRDGATAHSTPRF